MRTPRRSIGYVQPFDYQVAKRPEASKQRGKSAETVPLGCVGVLTSCSIVGICHLGIAKSLTYIIYYIIVGNEVLKEYKQQTYSSDENGLMIAIITRHFIMTKRTTSRRPWRAIASCWGMSMRRPSCVTWSKALRGLARCCRVTEVLGACRC